MQFNVAVAVCLAFAHASIARPFNPTLPGQDPGFLDNTAQTPAWVNDPRNIPRPQPAYTTNGPTPVTPLTFWPYGDNQAPPYPPAYGPNFGPYSPSAFYQYQNSLANNGAYNNFASSPLGTFGNSGNYGNYNNNNGFGIFQKDAKPQHGKETKA
ncbi:hypothetical protein PtA15_3A363 [Puccinia triticina]|uniref:Secreted protein n=1 Tax=Puccinia triticina TaxID=208348 RepID=A0ABY7CGC9_9BASI|nr:uncharacterized protein PtA15_3A363 [Puccinia triticina]WAQ82997.1 hypothetical protein PtA15_3A363 [Puccinia triticina]